MAPSPPGSAVRGMLAEVGVRGVLLSALWVVAFLAGGVYALVESPCCCRARRCRGRWLGRMRPSGRVGR